MTEIQAVSTNNVPVNGQNQGAKKKDNDNEYITIHFEDLSPEEQAAELKRGELITELKILNEKTHGVPLADDAVVYDMNNEELEQELAKSQKYYEHLNDPSKETWWEKLDKKIDKAFKKWFPLPSDKTENK
ncbi:MAG: hypothetical protein MJ180_05665 [Candidatus Gastranaerophilales bacterium]|nr:hypothetical protein [Candidatus Gastranaerophilales bacterium]